MRDDRQRLLDLHEAIERIEKYAVRDREAFEQDELIQTWIVHHLEIMGEAVRALSDEFRAHHTYVPWSSIIGMRNILIHQDFGIDTAAVWAVVEHNLPDLKRQVESFLQVLPDQE